MADTTFVSKSAPAIPTAWLQDLNDLFYRGTKALTVTALGTPLVQSVAANLRLEATGPNAIFFKTNGIDSWLVNSNGNILPNLNNTYQIGGANDVVSQVVTPVIDSGSATQVSIKTNNGTEQFRVAHLAGVIVNLLQANGNVTGNAPQITAIGSDTNIGVSIFSKGTGSVALNTGGGLQVAVLDTVSASRFLTFTGSNGGAPTINVSAGGFLAITPNIQLGGTTASNGIINVPFNNPIISRNQANSSDLNLIGTMAQNGVNDVTYVGETASSKGVQIAARVNAGAPAAADVRPGTFVMWRDTLGATTKIFYNNAGALMSVSLT